MTLWNKIFGKGQGIKPKKNSLNETSSIVEKYLNGLKNAYFQNNGQEEWESFEKVIYGAKKDDINKLNRIYPDVPNTLIKLLEYVDGTYWREYAKEKIIFFLLGSDIYEYPYYLLSTKEIIENQNQAKEYFSEYIERKYDEIEVDEKIADKSESVKWLHFSDCMNNGGTSQLFIDFSPSEKGTKGQVIRSLHDPDELKVIANSFDEYLNMLIKKEFDFINLETME